MSYTRGVNIKYENINKKPSILRTFLGPMSLRPSTNLSQRKAISILNHVSEGIRFRLIQTVKVHTLLKILFDSTRAKGSFTSKTLSMDSKAPTELGKVA